MLVRSAVILRSYYSAGIMRRAVSSSVGGGAAPEGGIDGRAATAGARACPGGLSATGSGARPRGEAAPARGVQAAQERLACGLAADDSARTRDACSGG